MKTFRCYVGDPRRAPFVIAFNVQATDGQEARQQAADRVLSLTEERGNGANLTGWETTDGRLYFTHHDILRADLIDLIDAVDMTTGEEA